MHTIVFGRILSTAQFELCEPLALTGDLPVGRGRHGALGGGLGVAGAVLFGGAAAEGDARDGGQVGRGALGQRRVAHLQQEVALVHDAGACGEGGREEISLRHFLSIPS